MKPIISIIVPVYNTEKYLNKCLESIVNQSIGNIEIIIVNDGSTDNSQNIINIYSSIYKNIILIEQNNLGLSGARNSGILAANGKYISFIDSDDWIDTDLYKKILEMINQLEVDLIGFNHILTYEDNSKIEINRETYNSIPISGEQLFNELIRCNSYQVASCFHLYNREFLLKNNLFFIEGLLHEDIAFTPFVYLKAERAIALNINGYYYRQRISSISNTFTIKHAMDLLQILKLLIKDVLPKLKVNRYFKYYIFCWYFTILDRASSVSKLKEIISKKVNEEFIHNNLIFKIVLSFRWNRTLIKFLLFTIHPSIYFFVFNKNKSKYLK